MRIFYSSLFKWAMVTFFCLFLSLAFNPVSAQIDFTKSDLDFAGFGPAPLVTSLTYGPDGRLYVLSYPGEVYVLTVQKNGDNNYVVTAKEEITAVQSIPNHDDDGKPCSGTTNDCNSREATGLVVVGTAANPILYVTSSDFRIGSGPNGGFGDLNLDTNSGIITRLTWNGTSWDAVDMVRGLPRSEENHATNGLEFTTIGGIDYLIVAQGGHANAGSPSINFSMICEYALSASILSVDLTALEAMPILDDNGRDYIYDLPTLDDPTRDNVNGITDPNNPAYDGIDVNDPFGGNDGLNQAMVVSGGPVQIFAPGFRNPYDLVITENGAVYASDNGANGGWGGFPINEGSGAVTNNYDPNETGGKASTAAADGEFVNNKDHLQLITTNKDTYTFGSFYGGHPNPTRANPTGAGLYTAPALIGTSGAVFRTQTYDPDESTTGSTDNTGLALPANWPPVPTANPVEGDWRGPGVPNPDGPNDDPITTWETNTNGIDEYTASTFDGAMKGNLLAGSSLGQLRRVELKPDGTLDNFTPVFEDGIGGNALGITCNGDDEIFPGTIWAGTLNGKIVVFEPLEPDGVTFPFRINAGGPEVTHNGDLFLTDQYFVGGITFSNTSATVPTLFETERTNSQPAFDYEIPVPDGNYDVVLHFAEIFWGATGGGAGGAGSRIFDVSIEGNLILDDYDIIADVGSETPVAKTFNITVTDGNLDLNFSALAANGGVDQAKVSAIEILANNIGPTAVASATPLNGDIPLEVAFTGDTSTDDVAVVNYLWDFKDGSPTSNTTNPTHTFTVAGTYDVELTVEDAGGFSDTTTISITASTPGNQAPVAIATASPENGALPLQVSFTGDGSTDDVAVVSYLWDFKDGSTVVTEPNPTHTFTTAGTYQVELTVEDGEGLTNSTTVTIVAGNEAPVAIINATPENGNAPLEVIFDAASSTDDVAVESYLWDFGDGSPTSTETAPTHTFVTAGTYVVSLTVADGEGLSNTQTVTIVVGEAGKSDVVGMLLVNPADKVAQVRIIDKGPGVSKVAKIYVHDSAGRLVATHKGGDIVASGLYEVPIAGLNSDEIYYLGFEMASGDRITINLVVNH
ncbi:PKD domain-containing protein [Maribacter sp. 2307UL18-2]|uniref:PKD domain-containing protein n=1 Tax=Maribacter sp. 2307UL18-2 TaxID=3386274 RepID=UPI0039BD1EAE